LKERLVIAPNGRSAGCIRGGLRRLAQTEGRFFHARVDLGVAIGRLQTHVAQPSADDVDVDARFEEMDRCGMPPM
jgi:hypothetical protein